MDAIIPLQNLPNLKQGQNGVEIYGIDLDIKAHLPWPKETGEVVPLLFLPSLLIVIIIAAVKKFSLSCFNLFTISNNIHILKKHHDSRRPSSWWHKGTITSTREW
jgi:hypothetical protein